MSPSPGSRLGEPLLLVIVLAALGPPTEGAWARTAQEDLTALSLEDLLEIEVVTTAAKVEQTTFEAPGAVSVVTAHDVEVHGYRTLSDVLRSVTGFWVIDDRNYEHVGVRGFGPLGDYNSRVLLLVDGHRVNNNVYDTAAIGLEFPLDVDLIERIEIVRGPGSVLYGSNAFFGVINVVTKSGAAFDGPEVALAGGSFETFQGRTSWGRALGADGDLLLSGTVFDSAGDEHSYPEYASSPSGGTTDDTDYERGFSLFGRYARGEWRAEIAWATREKGIPTGSYGTVFDDPDNRTVDGQGYVDVSWQRALDAHWELAARAFYDRYVYRGDYIYDDTANGGPPDLRNDDRGDGEWLGTELRATNTELARQRLTLGAEVRANLRQDQYNADEFAVYLDDERDSITSGVYLQDEIALAERWHLNLGLRHDYYETFGGTTNPRAALVYQPDERTAWKLVAGRAFRAPNAYELYYGDGYSAKANPDLDPETIAAYEVIFERHFTRSLRAAASVYWYEIDDLVVQTIDPNDGLLVFRNSASLSGPGAELELERRWEGGTRLRVSWAVQDVEDADGGELPNSPEHVAQALFETPCFTPKLLAGLDLQALSARDTLAGGEVDPYLIANLTLSTPSLPGGFFASLSIQNLFDEDYADPGPPEAIQDELAQDGRTFLVRLHWSR